MVLSETRDLPAKSLATSSHKIHNYPRHFAWQIRIYGGHNRGYPSKLPLLDELAKAGLQAAPERLLAVVRLGPVPHVARPAQ